MINFVLILFATLAAGAGPAIPPPLPAPGAARPPETALFGLSWGDALQEGMTPVEGQRPSSEAKLYHRAQDKLELDGVPLVHIWYDYAPGHLVGIQLRVEATKKDDLVRALMQRWGPPAPQQDGSVAWMTPTVRAVLRQLRPPFEKFYILNVFEPPELMTPASSY